MDKVFTYRDTFILLGIGLIIILIAFFNTLLMNFIFISLWGVHVGFGNCVKKFKVVNGGSGR